MLKLSLLGFGLLTVALVAPSVRAAVSENRSPSPASQNIDRQQRRISKFDFNERNNSNTEFEVYVGNPEKRQETLEESREVSRTLNNGKLSKEEKERVEQEKEAKSYYDRAKTRATSGDHIGAISDLNLAIRLQPKYALAYFQRGMAKYRLNNKTGAIADYNLAIEIESKYAEAYRQRADVKSELGDKKSAALDYDRAIQINPQYTQAYFHRGYDRAESGDNQGGIADFESAIKLNPQYVDAYRSRAIAKYKLGDKKGAILDLNIAAQMYKDRQDGASFDQTIAIIEKISN